MTRSWLNTDNLWNLICGSIIFAGAINQYYYFKSISDDKRRIAECTASSEATINGAIWSKLPIEIAIDESVPFDAHEAIYQASSRWEDVLGRPAFAFSTSSKAKLSMNDGKSIIYWNTGEYEQPAHEQAAAKVKRYGSRIYDADIIINAKDSTISYNKAVPAYAIDLESLMIHELGHAIGLDHIENGGVMNRALGNSHDRREIDLAAAAQARCLYAYQAPPFKQTTTEMASVITDARSDKNSY